MKSTEKMDLYKLHKDDYSMPRKPVVLTIPPATYLAVRGQGEPGGPAFIDRIGALYGVAFTVKMTWKFAGKQDYAVCKLEAQWWSNGGEDNFALVPQKEWCWKLLIRTPSFISQAEIDRAIETLLERGKGETVREVKLESIDEGLCVQMLHVGPYAEEPKTIAIMRAQVEDRGFQFHGRHHEIYISDPRRVAPERLKTILRQPIRKAQVK
ncbi:MAG: GyrI-like domain-containing protein [Verrucomicrobiota bacterium]